MRSRPTSSAGSASSRTSVHTLDEMAYRLDAA